MSKQGSSQFDKRQQRASQRDRARRAAQRRKKLRAWALPVVLLLAIGTGVGVTIATHTSTPAAHAEVAPTLGSASARVVLAEYGDFQCPSCGAFARQYEPKLRTAFIKTGKVRLEWHDFAWKGPESTAAANAARCAGDQGKFWEYHDLLYADQAGENTGALANHNLEEFGQRLGLDASQFKSCVEHGSHLGAVRADMDRVSSLGLTGTPSFFVNDKRVSASPQEIQHAIEAALA